MRRRRVLPCSDASSSPAAATTPRSFVSSLDLRDRPTSEPWESSASDADVIAAWKARVAADPANALAPARPGDGRGLSATLGDGRASSSAATTPAGRASSDLVLLRHGESIFNGEPVRFTGWADVPLTALGEAEAARAGALLASGSRGFDVVFTSELRRAYRTAEIAVDAWRQAKDAAAAACGGENSGGFPAAPERAATTPMPEIVRDWRLNERHYGALQVRRFLLLLLSTP